MREFATDAWMRATLTLQTALKIVESDPDSAASRAYYAAFHAVTALFAVRGHTFKKHSALRAAVPRDLVNTQEWPEELGVAYDYLMDLRDTGDYGGPLHVSAEDARDAVEKARSIIEAVRGEAMDIFVVEPETGDSPGG